MTMSSSYVVCFKFTSTPRHTGHTASSRPPRQRKRSSDPFVPPLSLAPSVQLNQSVSPSKNHPLPPRHTTSTKLVAENSKNTVCIARLGQKRTQPNSSNCSLTSSSCEKRTVSRSCTRTRRSSNKRKAQE